MALTKRESRALTGFGPSLKKMREKANLTQWDVAHACSFSTAQFVSNWERNVSRPPIDLVPKLASLFKVKPKDIYELYRARDLAEVTSRYSNLGLPRIQR